MSETVSSGKKSLFDDAFQKKLWNNQYWTFYHH